jgi:hypothetical protein
MTVLIAGATEGVRQSPNNRLQRTVMVKCQGTYRSVRPLTCGVSRQRLHR